MSRPFVFCKDCKFYLPNTTEWTIKQYQLQYANCSVSTLDPVNGVAPCARERTRLFIGCGKAARFFVPKDKA